MAFEGTGTALAFGDFVIDRADERVLGPDGPLKLGHKAYCVLLSLAEQEGRLLTKDALFASVWDGTIVSESALTSTIKELRRALGDESRTPRYIESVYGRGYRLLPKVRQVSAGAAAVAAEAPPAPVQRPSPAEPTGRPPLLHIPAFEDLRLNDSQPHLAAVVREEILLALSRFRDINLVSDAATGAAAADGGYGERDYQLSVKLVHDGASARAFARLSRLAGGSIIWADTIDLTGGNVGPNVDLLVRRVAAAALPRLQDDLLCRLPERPNDVYDAYFLTKLKMRGLASFAEARAVAADWERLIEDHPGFAPAYPPLTRLYNTDHCYTGLGSTGEAERRRAYELAHKAFALDPTESHLHTVKGWAHLWAGEAALARVHLEQAAQLNPYNQSRLDEVATGLMYLDDLEGAAKLLEQCRTLTPFATEAPHEEQGKLHFLRGEFELASRHLALVRRHHPDDPAGTKPTIKAELLGLLAAAGSGAADLAERAERWRKTMAEGWCGGEPPGDERLKQWVLYHNPFQDPGRRQWLLDLLDRALEAGHRSEPTARARAGRGTRSAPPAAAAASPAGSSMPS